MSAAKLAPPVAAGRILVADDNREIADLLAELLESLGYAVDARYDGAAVRAVVEATLPRCAILDISMPDEDGCALARWIRARPDGGAIRLIALTGHTAPEDCANILAAGFDVVLPKPFDLEHLEAALQGATPQSSSPQSSSPK